MKLIEPERKHLAGEQWSAAIAHLGALDEARLERSIDTDSSVHTSASKITRLNRALGKWRMV